MNSATKAPSRHFYPLIAGTAILAAFVISPAPDVIGLVVLSSYTIAGGLLLGFFIRRWSRLALSKPSVVTLAAVTIGILGSLIAVLGIRCFSLPI